MKGIRHFLRDFTASAVKEHLRSQVEDTEGAPDLTKNEIELVRFIQDGSFNRQLAQSSSGSVMGHERRQR